MIIYTTICLLAVALMYIRQRVYGIKGSIDSYKEQPRKHGSAVLFFASMMLLVLLSGLRVDVGTDYNSYMRWFEIIRSGGSTYFEVGYVALIDAIQIVTSNDQSIFFVSSLLTVGLVFAAIRSLSTNPALSTFLFIAMPFYFASFNGVRQYIAAAIILVGLRYLLRRNAVKFIATTLLASLFHTSALLMIPLYFILGVRHSYRALLAVVVLSLSSILFRDNLIPIMTYIYPMYENSTYILDKGYVPSEVLIFSAILSLAIILYLHLNNRFDIHKKLNVVTLNLVFYSLILHTALAWVPSINRLALYVDISYIIILPYLISLVDHKKIKAYLIVFILSAYSIYTFISIGINNSNHVLPYRSILTDTITIEGDG